MTIATRTRLGFGPAGKSEMNKREVQRAYRRLRELRNRLEQQMPDDLLKAQTLATLDDVLASLSA